MESQKKEITTLQLNIFVVSGKAFTEQTPLSKLWFAVDKVLKTAKRQLELVEKRRERIRREHALKKEKGIYDLNDRGGWQFDDKSLEKMLPLLEAIEEELVEIPTKIIPKGDYDEKLLSHDMRIAFEGIVIPEIDHDYEIENFKEPVKPEPEVKKAE